jgi:hypothetical protein
MEDDFSFSLVRDEAKPYKGFYLKPEPDNTGRSNRQKICRFFRRYCRDEKIFSMQFFYMSATILIFR